MNSWFSKVWSLVKIYSTKQVKEVMCSMEGKSSGQRMAQILLPRFKIRFLVKGKAYILEFPKGLLTKARLKEVRTEKHLTDRGWERERSGQGLNLGSALTSDQDREITDILSRQSLLWNLTKPDLPLVWASRLKPPSVEVSDHLPVANHLVVPRTACTRDAVGMSTLQLI